MPIGQRGVKRKAPALVKPSIKSTIVKKQVTQPARPVIQSVADSINQLNDDWNAESSEHDDDAENDQTIDESDEQTSPSTDTSNNQPTREWTDIQSLLNPKFPQLKPYHLPSKLTKMMVDEFHFPSATPVQYQTIPYLLSNFDPIIESMTGSGKTLAYVLPVLSLLFRRHTKLKKHEVGAIILAPTHELAKQIEQVIQKILESLSNNKSNEQSNNQDSINYPSLEQSLILLSLIGGVRDPTVDLSMYQSNGGNIVVATPGRLEQFLKTQKLNVRELTILVLDEADQLLSSGFEQSINHILSALPKQRRTALFSATQQSINEQQIRRVGMKQPQYIQVSIQIKQTAAQALKPANQPVSTLVPILTQNTPLSLKNFYIELPVVDKFAFLLRFILKNKNKKLIIFLMTCAAVDYFSAAIQDYMDEVVSQSNNQTTSPTGQRIVDHSKVPATKPSTEDQIKIIPLHGRLPGPKRTAALSLFSSTQNGCVMIASDVAARGLDIVDVDVIVQFDAPNKPDFFIHRVGRTARAGRQGSALLLISPHEDVYPNFLEKQGVPIEQKYESDLIDQAIATDDQTINQTITSDSVTQWLFDRCLCDRAYFEGAQSALVSFIRGYKEHELKFIFELHRLPFAELARLYGCLLFPMMSDLKHLKINYDSGIQFDAQQIAFTDPKREKQRQANEAIKREKRQAEKDARIAEMRARIKEKGTLRDQIREKRAKRKPHLQIKAEWDELAKDTRAIKKAKKGKLTKKQMEAVLMGKGEDSDSDMDSD